MKKFIYCENKFGLYAVPKVSSHRPAAKHIINGNIWEKNTLEYIDNLNLKNEVIHAGTYFGDFIPFLSTIFKKIWAFEISKNNYEAAEETIRLNNIDNVNLYRKALGDEDKIVNIETNINNQDLGGVSRVKNYKTNETIEQVKIDDIVPENSIIDLIQLDIEGYEINAIKGAMSTIKLHKPILILEDNYNHTEKEWFKINIIDLGYRKVTEVDDNKVFKYKD
jgi:FkbM family methyltransferase|tara:strand:+ start:4509 stop:5174 length:666 start_codon:yes stop_codon:yes gene_type:complete